MASFGIIVRQHHTDQKQMGLPKEQCEDERRDICDALAVKLGNEWWADSYGMLLSSTKHSRSLVWWENAISKTVRNAFNGPIPFGAMVEHHHICAKDQSGLHQFAAKVSQGIFVCYVLYVGRIWKGRATENGENHGMEVDESQKKERGFQEFGVKVSILK